MFVACILVSELNNYHTLCSKIETFLGHFVLFHSILPAFLVLLIYENYNYLKTVCNTKELSQMNSCCFIQLIGFVIRGCYGMGSGSL